MHLTVMEAAQLHKVGKLRLASLSPVVDVMCIDVPRVRATRESAAAIACVERAANRRRNAACLASDVERLTVLVLQDADDAGVARQATHGLRREGGAVLELAASRAAVAQRLSIHMHDDLLAVSRVQCLGPVLQETLSDPAQGISATRTPRGSLVGRLHDKT